MPTVTLPLSAIPHGHIGGWPRRRDSCWRCRSTIRSARRGVAFSTNDYFALIVGGVLLAASTVMREAARLAEENARFV